MGRLQPQCGIWQHIIFFGEASWCSNLNGGVRASHVTWHGSTAIRQMQRRGPRQQKQGGSLLTAVIYCCKAVDHTPGRRAAQVYRMTGSLCY